MCGIAGLLSFRGDAPVWESTVHAATDLVARRGPDDAGFWTDGRWCALGFRRLSILDPSAAGHQPMLTPDARHALVYNGELYNFRELRRELEDEGVAFRSRSDTEVVLHMLARRGVRALERFNGMFALGFYDAHDRRLLLARDHAGMKPLYHLRHARGVVFGSQYDQILAHPWSRPHAPDPSHVALFLAFDFIPAPCAVLRDTHMVEPGSWIEFSADGSPRTGRFFEFPRHCTPDLHGEEAVEAVTATVGEAVRRHLVSDVPVGVYLSGGVDSPLVAALAQSASDDDLPAFTLGTSGDAYDESARAATYAREFGMPHFVHHTGPAHALALLDDVVACASEPLADYSLFPSLCVARHARDRVKVVLSGDGGDELFWGYTDRAAGVLRQAPRFRHPPWRRVAARVAGAVSGEDGHWGLRHPTIGAWYEEHHGSVPRRSVLDLFDDVPPPPADLGRYDYRGWDRDRTAQWIRWAEFTGHLPKILLKVDRASMHHGLEVRMPLLDRAVVDVATRIDWRSCVDLRTRTGKLPLRRTLARHSAAQDAVKRGFTVAIDEWLRGPLRPVLEERLLGRSEIVGLRLRSAAVRRLNAEHQSGRTSAGWLLWRLLALALWEDRHLRPATRAAAPERIGAPDA